MKDKLVDIANKATEWKLKAARARRAEGKANERHIHREVSEYMEEIWKLRKEKAILTARVSELQDRVEKVLQWKL